VTAPVPGLTLTRRVQPVPPTAYLYEPSLAVIIQGRKHVVLGQSRYWYDEASFLLTAVNLPTITEVLDANEAAPYLSILLKLDLGAGRQVMTEIDLEGPSSIAGSGMAIGPATPPLLNSLERLLDLLSAPQDIAVVGKLIHREILYRLLTSPAGARLRQTVKIGSQSNRTARAVNWLRENYIAPLRVEDLAERCGMGVRQLTALSPLQFQKHLRLHEARRLLLNGDMDAASAAFEVGYESATQFNREYRRLFGAPPMRDVKAIRSTLPIGAQSLAAL
jgi:AraC-like DNA-binding protein